MTAQGVSVDSAGRDRALHEAFSNILLSAAFTKAPALRSILAYLWEHRTETVSEYALATGALGRNADFDPGTDATVRVVIARLRQRLKKYYEEEGVDCPLRLSIPLGGHQLAVEFREPSDDEPASVPLLPVPEVSENTTGSRQWRLTATVAVIAVLAGLAAGMTISRPKEPRPSLARFWTDFLKGGKPTSVYVPTPVFASWPGTPVRMRDIRVIDPGKVMESDEIAGMSRRLGKNPDSLQSYTVGADTFAAIKLAQYLEARGVHVEVGGTNSLAMDSSLDRNIILPGTSWSSPAVSGHDSRC